MKLEVGQTFRVFEVIQHLHPLGKYRIGKTGIETKFTENKTYPFEILTNEKNELGYSFGLYCNEEIKQVASIVIKSIK